MADLREDPRYVDWSDDPRAVTCPTCGEKGLPFNHSLGGVSATHPETTTIVHGGIPYDHDPYGWFMGVRSPSAWEGMLAIRLQHDFEPRVIHG